MTNDHITRLEKVVETIQGIGEECDEESVDRVVLSSIIGRLDDFIESKKAYNQKFGLSQKERTF